MDATAAMAILYTVYMERNVPQRGCKYDMIHKCKRDLQMCTIIL